MLNITFIASEKRYTIGYGTGHVVAEVTKFDRSTPEYDKNENYSLEIFENVNPEVDPAFLLSTCIMIDYMEWPHYMPRI